MLEIWGWYENDKKWKNVISPYNRIMWQSIRIASAYIVKVSWVQRCSRIMKTCPCNEHPITPHFHIVKLGFTRVYIFFLFLLLNIDRGYSLEPPH